MLCRFFGREPSPFIFITASICAVYTLNRLLLLARLPMTLDGRIHTDQGIIMFSFFPIFSVVFFLLVLLLPHGWLDIDIDQAGRGVLHGCSAVQDAWSAIRALFHDGSPSPQGLMNHSTESGPWQVCAIESAVHRTCVHFLSIAL